MQQNDSADINADNIDWQEFTSERGKKYQVGYSKTSKTPTDSGSGPEVTKEDFGIVLTGM